MIWLWRLASSSIGKKFLMGLTGFGLMGFLVTHLAGNLLIFVGPDAYNGYAAALEHNPLLIPAEIGLAGLFALHIALALVLTSENASARPVPYAVGSRIQGKGGRNPANGTMFISGAIVLVFIILHLLTFKFAHHDMDAQHRKDFYKIAMDVFSRTPYALWYIFAVCVLGLHVRHGLQSAFRSVGFRHPKYHCALEFLSVGFGYFIAIGYASIPFVIYFFKAKGG
jgi:succinate dehydrogenase / fumarate reductase cytochrome b subunit